MSPRNVADLLEISGTPLISFQSDVTVIDGVEGTYGKFPFNLGNVAVVEKSFLESLLKEQIIVILSNPVIKSILGADAQRSINAVTDLRLDVSNVVPNFIPQVVFRTTLWRFMFCLKIEQICI